MANDAWNATDGIGAGGDETDDGRARAAAMPAGAACQQRVDTKGFTGKGTRSELRHLAAALDRLEQHMAELLAASKQVRFAPLHLALHRRRSSGYAALRWRAGGAAGRHLSWEDARAIYLRYPRPTRRWYQELTRQALTDNACHVELRRRIRLARLRIAEAEQALYPKPIPGAEPLD